MITIQIRPGRRQDGPALAVLDHQTWDPAGSPAPRPAPDADFFGAADPARFLVADDGGPVGYVKLARASTLATNAHVREIHGLAVAPGHQRRGIARQLLRAALEAAAATGARRVRLRALSTNRAAIALYRSEGFVIDVVLPEEFLIEGRYVDDVVMSYSPSSSST